MGLLFAAVIFNVTVNFRGRPLAPADFTPRDIEVIAAALDVVVPGQPVTLANETQAISAVPGREDAAIAHDFDARNQVRRAIGSLDLGRPLQLVDATRFDALKAYVTFPGYSADGRTALEGIFVEKKREAAGGIRPGVDMVPEWVVLENANGRWKVTRRESDPRWR